MDLVSKVNGYFFCAGTSKELELAKVYSGFSEISHLNEELRSNGVSPPEISNLNGRLNVLINSFENLRNIYEYRTSKGLKAYSSLFLHIFPLLYSPLFAYYSVQYHWVLGFLLCTIYSVCLMVLDCIQDSLENPFDQDGVDDIKAENVDFYLAAVNNSGNE